MNQDLKFIKKHYGEKMMQLCRRIFPTILEYPTILPKILLEHFEPSRCLYDDLMSSKKENEFKEYIYNFFDSKYRYELSASTKTCRELMTEAGYDLYKCETEEEIQYFRRYYSYGEELCTFRGERLNWCEVFFAVKKDVDSIKRENFKTPQRQDEYGTSVISIQFTKDKTHTLSIKNRYNHRVPDCDATFSNDLENIIPGLTMAFEKEYGLAQKNYSKNFSLPGYVSANDGRFYRYDFERNNIYYCLNNNIIIDNFEVKRYPKERYILLEQFILDLSTCEVKAYDNTDVDSFPDSIIGCSKAQVIKEGSLRKIIMTNPDKGNIELTINENGRIVSINNPVVTEIKDNFLSEARELETIEMKNLISVGNSFGKSVSLKKIDMPSLEAVGDDYFSWNTDLEYLNMPKLRKAGSYCLVDCKLNKLYFPCLEVVGDNFFQYCNHNMDVLSMPNLREVGDNFFNSLFDSKKIDMPSLEKVGNGFTGRLMICEEINLSSLRTAGASFLSSLFNCKKINLDRLESVGEYAFLANDKLKNSFLKGNLRKHKITRVTNGIVKILKSKLYHKS